MTIDALDAALYSYAGGLEVRVAAGIERNHQEQLEAWRNSPIRAVDPPASSVFLIEGNGS